MLSTRAPLLGAALLLATGCSQLQLASAGQTACAPKEIQISDIERGWNSESWVATCSGKRFRCSSLSSAWSVDYSCKLEGERTPPDGAEPAPASETPAEDPTDTAAEATSPGGDTQASEAAATDSTTGDESSAQEDAPGDDASGDTGAPEADTTDEPSGGDDHP